MQLARLSQKLLNHILPLRSKVKPYFFRVEEDSRFFLLLNALGIKKLSKKITFLNTLQQSHQYSPCYIPVKIPFMDGLADANCILNPKLLDAYKNSNIKLLYDLSTEPVTYSAFTSELLLKFHTLLQDAGVDSNRVTLICSNYNAQDEYDTWANKHNLGHYRIKMIGYHFYLYEYFWEISKCEWLQKNFTTLINKSAETVTQNKMRSKHFICLNLRPRRHRTATVLHLMQRQFLDKGHVTYFGSEFGDHGSVENRAETIDFLQQLDSGSRLIPYLDELNNKSPITLDKDSQKMRDDLWHLSPGQVEFLIPEASQLSDSGIDTYFEIITETWFTDSANLYITEKTIRSIIRLQPFIHIGSPYLLKHLNDIGFKTFSPYINEEYDSIEDPAKRMEVIFKEIDRLCNMSLSEIHELYCKLWPILEHNLNHFLKNTKKIAIDELNRKVISQLN